MNIPIYPILRQMAFEVLYSFICAGLIKKDIALIWEKEFHKLKTTKRLLNPNELNPDSEDDENDYGDEFSVGKIHM